ncbi:hypothetical protein ACHWQZ_G008778 [Mnemiopsis leidyi]
MSIYLSILLFLIISTCQPLKETDDWICQTKEKHGFIRRLCRRSNPRETIIKCHNSEEKYRLENDVKVSGEICSKDPHFYQA